MNLPSSRRRLAAIAAALAILGNIPARADRDRPSEQATAEDIPEKYVLDYPAAERFCPPVAGAFEEASRTLTTLGRRVFRHPPNGNFGFVQKVRGQALVHVGADLALFRVGDPVFAVADGVVRLSSGPDPQAMVAGRAARRGRRKAADVKAAAGEQDQPANSIVAPWGNLVVIEHRLPDGEFVTTIYGHLDTDRLVQVGDLVRAGQQIGEVGRRHPLINGGYHEHLHFGVRAGRLAEPGRALLPLDFGSGQALARIATVSEDDLELDCGKLPESAGDFRLNVAGLQQEFRRRGDRYVVSSRLLWLIPTTPDFPLVGHTSSPEGFFDPIAFLRARHADTRPAPFIPVRRK